MDETAQLRDYASCGTEAAFAALVQRYLPLVYATALRRVGGDSHRAKDVAQLVFVALARNAERLASHPDLTAWLFTTTRFLAAKAVRGERRRQLREQSSSFVSDVMSETPASGASERLHAMLDDAVTELREVDRQVILLRFHRGLRLLEIGRQLGLSENAVQKRLERALERLRDRLARRGITSTAAALAVAFEQQSAVAIPAGLAAAATSAGIACGVAAGGLAAISTYMIVSKLQFVAAVTLLIAAASGVAWQAAENRALHEEGARQNDSTVDRTRALSAQLAALTQRAEATDADVIALRGALHAAKNATPVARRVLIDVQEQAKAEMAQVDKLIREGRHQEALVLLLKCYRALTGAHGIPNQQQVASRLKGLAREYSPAGVALRELRAAALKKWQLNPEERDLVSEVAMLNERLGDGRASMALFDRLPLDHAGRQAIGLIAHDAFVEARRYRDALVGKSFGNMIRELELGIRSTSGLDGRGAANWRSFVVQSTLTNIEVLAGAGKAEEARWLTNKLLAFDDTEATRAAIEARIARATTLPMP